METEILIIGAGVYGITLANYLAHQKKKFIVVGEYMDLWRNHTFSNITLRSDFGLSEIGHPLDKFSCENYFKEVPEHKSYIHKHLPANIFRRYLDWVEKNLEYKITTGLVLNLDTNSQSRFVATLQSGVQIQASKVVVATGFSHHIYIPPELSALIKKSIHSYYTHTINEIKNSKVLVIGAGQSAGECIETLLRNNNTVAWYRRHAPRYFEQPVNIPAWIFRFLIQSAGLFRSLPPLIRNAVNRLISTPTIMPAYKKILDGLPAYNTLPEPGAYDCIISATGFKLKIANLDFLSEKLKMKLNPKLESPILNRFFQSDVDGLFFCGAISEPSFGPAVKFIVGSHYSAAHISSKL